MNENPTTAKSPAVAYLLWFFLGSFGAHRFYMGRNGSGLGMAGLFVGSIVGSVFLIGLIGFPILFGWWLVDAYLISKWLNPNANADSSGTMTFEQQPAAGDEPVREAA
ncbi:MAG: TM2 domain-containing protein [Planctomycetota bacterium]|jgi:TM2 domain-containing membrane protein YozV